MAPPGPPRVTPVSAILRTDDPEARRAVLDGLGAYNDATTDASQEGGPLSAVLRDGPDGPVLGGIIGRIYGSWLHLDFFHLPPPLRRAGHGARLLALLEAEARALGAVGAHLETFSFQARAFYERHGYEVYGTIPDYPPGHARHSLLKRLAPGRLDTAETP